jgi:hypothetical protein
MFSPFTCVGALQCSDKERRMAKEIRTTLCANGSYIYLCADNTGCTDRAGTWGGRGVEMGVGDSMEAPMTCSADMLC